MSEPHGFASPSHSVNGVRIRPQMRVLRAIAMLAYSTGYPLLGLALWIGARDGEWAGAGVLVILSVVMSFLGWALLSYSNAEREGAAPRVLASRGRNTMVFLAMYNRASAIVILLASYAISAGREGWPSPESFAGWFAVVWVPLFVAFALPVERSSPPLDANE